MKQENFDEFCDLIDTVAEQHNKTMTHSLKMLYWIGLHDKDFEAVKSALFRHLRNPDTGMFMPKVADIMRMIEGSSEDSSMIAWTATNKALREKGTYVSVCFDDFLIHRVLQDMGGWIQLGTKTEDEWPFVAKEFQTRYRGYKSRDEKPGYPAHLIGIAEMHNAREGHKIDPPVLIGDKEKAKQVLTRGAGMIDYSGGIGLQPLTSDVRKVVNDFQNEMSKNIA